MSVDGVFVEHSSRPKLAAVLGGETANKFPKLTILLSTNRAAAFATNGLL